MKRASATYSHSASRIDVTVNFTKMWNQTCAAVSTTKLCNKYKDIDFVLGHRVRKPIYGVCFASTRQAVCTALKEEML